MSIGPSQNTKNAENTVNGVAQQGIANSSALNSQGSGQLDTGGQNVTSGTDYLQTVLNGNQANTVAQLQPNIDQIRGTTQQNLQAATTLQPRGGGRSGTLFGLNLAPASQIQGLYNSARTSAASALPQIGLAQQGIGTSLYGLGNQALNTGLTGGQYGVQNGMADTQYSNNLISGLAGSLFGLATAPITGFSGGSLAGAGLSGLGLCWVAAAIYGERDPRTALIRAYISGPIFRATRRGRIIVTLYRTFGRRVARVPWLCRMLRPAFDRALETAVAYRSASALRMVKLSA